MKKLTAGLIGAAMLAAAPIAVEAKTIGVALSSDTNPFYIAML